MLIDGEKWACEACVRGHRVSSCHHSDRPLTHINKKGRPVSQCTHCRGLRKSRTTHVKCECGDKKKNSSDCHTEDSHHRCGCCHGQRCTCALKKEHHLDPVPETGLPLSQPSAPAEPPRKPLLTSTKSESTLTIFRDGHHKPAHKHNDMAHKCGLPYTIPRSHTIHHPSDMPRRSVDHLPLTQSAFLKDPLPLSMEPRPQSQQASQKGSPDSAPAADDIATTPVDPSFLDKFTSPALPPSALDKAKDKPSNPTSAPATMDKFPLEQIITSVPPPLDVSTFTSFPNTTTNSPITCMAFQDHYQEQYFTSPDSDMPLGSAGIGAPSVDWSSFPLYSSDVPATSTQTPSYASFDHSYPSGLPPPSSSGDLSEADEFGPLPGLGHAGSNDIHDLHSVSESSDMDHLRLSSASSLVGLPQTQLLSSNDLDSINIDDFLKSANESTAALEHQLQASMGLEPKSVPAPDNYGMSQAPMTTATSMTSGPSPPDSVPVWPASLFADSGSTPPLDESYFRQSWAQ
ncbi:hypothetical protein NUU61_002975 [Penicillium alfredii]|uniref:Copper-fist domain-containing protein n=1 Tax=Penicillium alfredii TaxID=1506179 RepID=A0A9W9KHG0_9EURO|nr:uncharacterized protein NUU61_002975 [Penicillium alfredii]KAJ5105628.1 hypothetical protein NUU61_002975 [Penicillium alfredii]